jgi:hypothetical protein
MHSYSSAVSSASAPLHASLGTLRIRAQSVREWQLRVRLRRRSASATLVHAQLERCEANGAKRTDACGGALWVAMTSEVKGKERPAQWGRWQETVFDTTNFSLVQDVLAAVRQNG